MPCQDPNFDKFADATVFYNIHYIKAFDASGNFHPGTPGMPSSTNGQNFAFNLINHTNSYLNNTFDTPSNVIAALADAGSPSPYMGTKKIQFKKYHDPNNTLDLYGGIWYWDSQADFDDFLDLPANQNYRDKVYMIQIVDELGASLDIKGRAGSNGCKLLNLYKNISQGTGVGFWNGSPTLNEELFHALNNSDHAFEHDNPCNLIDLPCGNFCSTGNCSNTPTPDANCGSTWGITRNLMSYTEGGIALSCCQYQRAYMTMVVDNRRWLKFCETEEDMSPLILGGGQDYFWNTVQAYNRDVIIETGSSLTIQCEVYMGSDKRIIVRKGAYLHVDGGTISNLCDERWAGIRVDGITLNADGSVPEQETNPFVLSPTDNGIVKLFKARIIGAAEGISTVYSQSTGEAGGYIDSDRTQFINNRRAVEIMRYTRPNKSKFVDTDFFVDPTLGINNSIGVTIWDNHGILFQRCTFGDFELEGIMGIDYGAYIIDGCHFENCRRGVADLGISPGRAGVYHDLVIGSKDDNHARNIFVNNPTHIEINSPFNKTTVTNNDFIKGRYGVHSDGQARLLEVSYNLINSSITAGVWIVDSRVGDNRISCNTIDAALWGLRMLGNNRYSRFLENVFGPHSVSDIQIDGEVDPYQMGGNNVNDPLQAGNCFGTTGQNKQIVAAPSNVTPFEYFVPAGVQDCRIADPTGQGFVLVEALKPDRFNCSEGIDFIPGDDDKGRLISLRDEIQSMKDNGAESDLEKKMQLYTMEKEWYRLERYLLDQALIEGDIELLDQVLEVPGGEESYRSVGYLIGMEEYELASHRIDSLSDKEYIQDYGYIMSLYLRFIPKGEYIASESELDRLEKIIYKEDVHSPEAESLLSLISDRRIDLPRYSMEERSESSPQTTVIEKKKELQVQPNPGSEVIYLYLDEELVLDGQVELYDLQGKRKLLTALTNGSVHITDLQDGMYLLRLSTEYGTIHVSKIIKQ